MGRLIVNKDSLTSTLLVSLIILYLAQPVLGISGVIGPFLLVIIFLTSFYYSVKLWASNIALPIVCHLWAIFVIYYVLLYLCSAQIMDYSEARMALLNFLPFFAFYYFSVKGVLTDRYMIFIFVLLTIVVLLSIFISDKILAANLGYEEFANNMSYHIMGLLPFVFLLKRKSLQLIILFLFALYAVDSMKRAVLLVSLMSFFIFVFSNYYRIKEYSIGRAILSSTLILGLLAVLITAFYVYIGIGERFEERIILMLYEGHTSGRGEIASVFFDAWVNSNKFSDYLFGLGYMSWVNFGEEPAHNDFVKMLTEAGALGLLIFVFLIFALCRQLIVGKTEVRYRSSFAMLFVVILISATTSRWFGSIFFYMNCILLPFLIAQPNIKFSARRLQNSSG